MDAAVSLHAVVSLPLPPPHHHHTLPVHLHLKPHPSISSSSSYSKPTHKHRLAPTTPTIHRRAATGYAAALADASLRAGTLPAASLHARALIAPVAAPAAPAPLDARVAGLVRLLARKGKAALVPEVMAEFARICDELLAVPCDVSSS